MSQITVYWDCNATTPVEPLVADLVMKYMVDEFGNSASRTHDFGQRVKTRVEEARAEVARVVAASVRDVIFTSGATESNNIALIGLSEFGISKERRHIVSTTIEHKAVLEPLEQLENRGFEVTLVKPSSSGVVRSEDVLQAVRSDTLVVSVMAANNETGALQPIAQIARGLDDHECFLHTDAAQAFGKTGDLLCDPRIDYISVSGHKVFAPKGVGTLIARTERGAQQALRPIAVGGGQERGLRPGTIAAPLVIGFGESARMAFKESASRRQRIESYREKVLSFFTALGAQILSPDGCTLSHVLSIRLPGVDSEAFMLATKGIVAVSNGSACTSESYDPSHVLLSMGLTPDEAEEVVRISWCHLTPEPDWDRLETCLRALL